MEEMPDAQEARRRMIDFLRYARKYVPISEQRNRITRDIDRMKWLLKHPEKLRQHRNRREDDGRETA